MKIARPKDGTKRTSKPKRASRSTVTKDSGSIIRADLGGNTRQYGIADIQRQRAKNLITRYGRWVYLAVTIKSNVAASIPLRLFSVGDKGKVEKYPGLRPRPLDAKTKAYFDGRLRVRPSDVVMKAVQGRQDELTEITSHPILTLMSDVNAQEEGFSFRQQMYRDMLVFGEHFWYPQVEGGRPVEIWRMQPQLMAVFPGPDFISHYEYGTGTAKIQFAADEIIWFRIADPADPWGAFGPLAAWLKTIDADYAMQAFQEDVFAKGGLPDWMLLTKAPMDEVQKKTLRRSFRQSFAGEMGPAYRRAESIYIASGGEATLQKLSETPRELDYVKSQMQKRDEICAAFGVPKSFVDLDGVVANSAEGMNQFMTLSIWPDTTRIEESWNQKFVHRFWSPNLLLVHDNPIKDDPVIRIQEDEGKLRIGYSVNEVRLARGDEALDDPQADMSLVSSTLIPLGQVGMAQLPGLGGGITAAGSADSAMPQSGNVETAPAAGSAPAAAPAPSLEPGQIETSTETVLNGAQITAATAIVVSVARGEQPRDAGIGQLEVLFNLTHEQAERIMGSAGTNTPTTPNPNPARDAELEARREGLENTSPSTPEPGKMVGNDTNPNNPDIRGPCEHGHHDASSAPDGLGCAEVKQSDLWAAKAQGDEPQEGLPESGSLRGFVNGLDATLRKQVNAAIAEMRKTGVPQEAIERAVRAFADPDFQLRLADVSRPFLERGVDIGGKFGIDRLKQIAPTDVLPEAVGFDVTNPEVQRFVDNYAVRLADGVGGTFKESARAILGDGLEQGESVGQLVKRVQDWAGKVGDTSRGVGARAEMIARTESARAYRAGEIEAWKQTGVVEGKQWFLAADACEFCEAAAIEYANKQIGLDAAFYPKGHVLEGTAGGRMTLDYEAVEGPPLHPQCLLPGTEVSASRLISAIQAAYNGDAIRLTTLNGRQLTVTANHKLLTPGGFVPAHRIRKGDNLIGSITGQREVRGNPHNDKMHFGPVEDVFHALGKSDGMTRASVPVAAEHLYGDGRRCNGNINVVTSNRLLWNAFKAASLQHGDELPLCAGCSPEQLNGLGDFDSMLVRLSLAAHGFMGVGGESPTFGMGRVGHASIHGFATIAPAESGVPHESHDCVAVKAEPLSGLLDRFASLVSFDEVVDVEVVRYSGHVYDLQTFSGLYVAGGLLTSNCRCDLMPVIRKAE